MDMISRDIRTTIGSYTHVGSDRRSLHLVQKLPDFLQIRQASAVRIECPITLRTLREWVNQQLSHSAGMYLEVQVSGNRVLPYLRNSCEHRKLNLR